MNQQSKFSMSYDFQYEILYPCPRLLDMKIYVQRLRLLACEGEAPEMKSPAVARLEILTAGLYTVYIQVCRFCLGLSCAVH